MEASQQSIKLDNKGNPSSLLLPMKKVTLEQAGMQYYTKTPPYLDIPNLIQIQTKSFRWFQEEGLAELFQEFPSVQDFTGNQLKLYFLSYEFRHPRYTEQECFERDLTYSAPLYANVRLEVKETGELHEQEVFMSDIPLMTPRGTFIINGTERVIVNQLVRSPGVYLTLEKDAASGRELCCGKLIPDHGAWLQFETSSKNVISVKIEGKRKIPITTLLRAIGYGNDEGIVELFSDIDSSPEHRYIHSTMEREAIVSELPTGSESAHRINNREEALRDIYQRLRPGDPPDLENAANVINNLFFNPRHYDLGEVGRYKLNQRIGHELLLLRGVIVTKVLETHLTNLIKFIEENQGKLSRGTSATRNTDIMKEVVCIINEIIPVIEENLGSLSPQVINIIKLKAENSQLPDISKERVRILLSEVSDAIEENPDLDRNSISPEAATAIRQSLERFTTEIIEGAKTEEGQQRLHLCLKSLSDAGIGSIISESLKILPLEKTEGLVTKYFNQRALTKDDMVAVVRRIVLINNGMEQPDDIDHMGNRRVRTVGDLMQHHLRVGLLRLERMIKERMSVVDPKIATPTSLVNIRPLVTVLREFFAGSQLSQFMDQTNPISELTHKRRISVLGTGGLTRERAGFEVRDVHYSHYGRICPIETPEGPNVGLIGSLSIYATVNKYGFLETPYRMVFRELESNSKWLLNQTLAEAVRDNENHLIADTGTIVGHQLAKRISKLKRRTIHIVPFVSDQIVYLSADKEEHYVIAQANTHLDEYHHFLDKMVEVRKGKQLLYESPAETDFMDVSPAQLVSVTTALIPFLEHDDANRALMGANMQRQAVPLLYPDVPLVSTGMERLVAAYSGQMMVASCEGKVLSVTGERVIIRDSNSRLQKDEKVKDGGGEQIFPMKKFERTNQGTCADYTPQVDRGDIIQPKQIITGSATTRDGDLALGQNVLCAFMSWRGYNFEDAIIVSESLIREDKFTSIHIERYEIEAQDTKLGAEEITRDIPNVGEENLRNLDEAGIIHVGAEVEAGDILVGRITPKGETELTAEEKLLRALFGEKARKVKDTSLRLPHGERGTVTAVQVFPKGKNKHKAFSPAGQLVRVWVAQKRKLCAGDKLTGRHGNKGVVSYIVPVEDMPYLADGTSVEIILNPVGVPSRMNIGQILETHLGWAAHTLGFRAITPVFEGAEDIDIEDALSRAWIMQQSEAIDYCTWDGKGQPHLRKDIAENWLAQQGYEAKKVFGPDSRKGEAKRVCLLVWLAYQGVDVAELSEEEVVKQSMAISQEKGIPLPTNGKATLYDGCTGDPFDQPVTVGYIYMMKLAHLVEDKMHARSTGPYSLVTQQPLGGKAQFGGQRFGEMEAWALESYGAAYTLQELLTVKSDDVVGRAKAYEAIVKGEDTISPRIPESFKVLTKELQSLALSVEALNEEEDQEFSELPEEQQEIQEIVETSVSIEQLEADGNSASINAMEKGEVQYAE